MFLFLEAIWSCLKLPYSCPIRLPATVAEILPALLESLDDGGNRSTESKNGRGPSNSYCPPSVTPSLSLPHSCFTQASDSSLQKTCTLPRSGCWTKENGGKFQLGGYTCNEEEIGQANNNLSAFNTTMTNDFTVLFLSLSFSHAQAGTHKHACMQANTKCGLFTQHLIQRKCTCLRVVFLVYSYVVENIYNFLHTANILSMHTVALSFILTHLLQLPALFDVDLTALR